MSLFGVGKAQSEHSGMCGGHQLAVQVVQQGEDDPPIEELYEIAEQRAVNAGCRGNSEVTAYVETFIDTYYDDTEELDDTTTTNSKPKW
jgi:hypothetical protein